MKVISVNILYFNLGIGKDYIYKGVTKFERIHNHDELQLNDKQKEALHPFTAINNFL